MIKKTLLILTFITLALALNSCSIFNSDPLDNDNGSLLYAQQTGESFWILLGKDLRMDHYQNRSEVQAKIKWYSSHKAYLERVAKRGGPYVYYVLQQVKQRQLPSEIALLPIIESGYDPFAYSNQGAAGLWQMMPGTASGFRLRQNWWYDGRRDVYASTNAALNYLTYLNKVFKGDWLLAFAAYNSGEGTVDKAIKYNKEHNLPTDFWDLKLPPQTQQYVPNLLAIASIVADPTKYGMHWPKTELIPYVTAVPIGSQIDLSKAAKLADISLQQLYELNPGFNRWATDPNGSHMLLIPTDKVEQFKENLAKVPKSDRVSWERYTVKHGDSLNRIAHKFSTTPSLIKQINNLKSSVIHEKQILLIPRAKKTFAHDVLQDIKHYLHHERDLPGPNRIVHEVQPGDSLWKIAKDYKLQIRQIRFWNHLKHNEAIKPGSELILWTEKLPYRYQSVSVRPYLLHHTIKKGESLQGIAKKYHLSTAELKQANNLKTSTIVIGKSLAIPPAEHRLGHAIQTPYHYRVKAGENLISIAHKLGLKGSTLKRYNKLTKDTLQPGQILLIPRK
jgi:membrane-bound lytic murein transglycosylase D